MIGNYINSDYPAGLDTEEPFVFPAPGEDSRDGRPIPDVSLFGSA
jgi:hypothetical protein